MSFLCDPCCEKLNVWAAFQSRGKCEDCGKFAICREIPPAEETRAIKRREEEKAAKTRIEEKNRKARLGEKLNNLIVKQDRSYIDENGNYKPRITQESLDAALVYVMGPRFCEAVKNRPTRHDAAIKEIFVKDLEYEQTKEENHDVDMKISIMIIRIAAQRLEKHGQYVWDDNK